MRELQLENSNLIALIDDEDFERVNKHKWYLNNKGYAFAWVGLMISLSHFITQTGTEFEIDHKNLNKLDYQKVNLREADRTQQLANTKKRVGNFTSKYKGVSWSKQNSFWVTQIKKNYQITWLGRFYSEEAAARAYDKAAIKYFGEFARLNFPR